MLRSRVRLSRRAEGSHSLPAGPAHCRHATPSCQRTLWCPVVQAHAEERAILQVVVDEAALMFKDEFAPNMTGRERAAQHRLAERLRDKFNYRVNVVVAPLADMHMLRPPSMLASVTSRWWQICHASICLCKADFHTSTTALL